MAVKRICGCSVTFWCFFMLCIDIFLGLLFAMKHFDFDLFNLRRQANRHAGFWSTAGRCLDLGLGKLEIGVEMSLLVIAAVAMLGLCCRKSKLLIPYLILKVVVICVFLYMTIMYAMHFKDCGGLLFAQALALIIAVISYGIIAGTYKTIKGEYSTIDSFIP